MTETKTKWSTKTKSKLKLTLQDEIKTKINYKTKTTQRHVAITFYLVRVCTVLTVHSLYRHQLHGTICLHIFAQPLCRSFYLNSSLTFSSPFSLLSSIIPYSPHTLFRCNSFFFLFIFTFILYVCFYLCLMSLCLAPQSFGGEAP